METNSNLKKLGLVGSFAIYIPAALLMYLCTMHLIPYLSEITNQETILLWFLASGILVFTPLVVLGIIILRYEGYKISHKTWKERLRFRKLTPRDLIWSMSGLIVIGILSGLIMRGLKIVLGDFDHSPPFMSFQPLTITGKYWLLIIWAPYWVLNILGEEFIWRGVMMPRQELVFGKYTWLIHGFGWSLFHIPFGWHLLATLVPILFIQSYVVQKTKNSWNGAIIHGGLNGPSFIAICFGLI
jgi:membrane protease YdiL (CAAX protease family)